MKAYCGRRVRIGKYEGRGDIVDTGKSGHLLEIDVKSGWVMIEDEDGNIVKLSHKLVKFIYGGSL